MNIFLLNADNWKADGGATFGVVPKTLWESVCPADENNLVNAANKCLLVKTGDRLILFDTGMGDKQDEKFFKYRYRFGNESLLANMAEVGFSPEEVTDVVFTHLHYDHCGGASRHNADRSGFELVFKNARHWVSEEQWKWANKPNKREAASFLPENLKPLEASGQLHLIRKEGYFCDDVYLRLFYGHTAGQIIPQISFGDKTLVYTADFIASSAHVPLVYIPAYDIQPLITLDEKEVFLTEAADKNYILVFEHDSLYDCCRVENTPRGFRALDLSPFSVIV
ncbi:MAG: MBL fold metallo-hydrolase [Bacteroidales bacterium]|nr:MBL fold metallo-hydrolase [Bacteroidales bacterium]